MNAFLNFISQYWIFIILIIAIVVVGGYYIYHFYKTPSDEQIQKVKQWLLYAVMMAEKELGSKTGELKLEYVYNLFISKFPAVANMISFERFSSLVDEVLQKFEQIIEGNENIKNYVSRS